MKLAQLAMPFPEDQIHWRVQGSPYERNGAWSAMALAYLDARDVMDRLDAVCEPQNWQSKIEETSKGRVICSIGILCGDQWVWKADGAGDTAVEGDKGAVSDALKRAAVNWGIGRYLYRIASPWVPCEVRTKNGKTYWRKWSVDPWSRVKVAPNTDKKTDLTNEEKRDYLKKQMNLAKTQQQINSYWEKVTSKVESLPPPMQAELESEWKNLAAQLPDDPAMQAPPTNGEDY